MAIEGKLIILAGFVTKKEVILPPDGEFTIGRDHKRDLAIMSRRISRNHAKIACQAGSFTLSDEGSKRGTSVNEQAITKTVLRNKDIIQIGNVKIRFEMRDAQKPIKLAKQPSVPILTPPKPAVRTRVESTLKARLPKDATKERPFTEDELSLVGKKVTSIKIIATLAKTRRALVYKGIQSARNRLVAFKILQASAAEDPEIVRWFIRGARVAGQFRHDECVRVLGGGHEDDIFFLFMPFKENGSAQERFPTAIEEGLPAVKSALQSIVHVSRALEFVQAEGILHLGVRPSKILYDERQHAKLNGVGFDNSPSAPGTTKSVDVEAYLAPEQITGSGKVTAAADIFGLGATFYYMLTGQRPERDRRHRIASPKQANPLVPDSICRIVEKMLAPDPERRYKTYGQLLHDVRWALRGEAWPHR